LPLASCWLIDCSALGRDEPQNTGPFNSCQNEHMGKKCTKYEKEKRILQFVQMLSKGAVNSELFRYASDEWGIGKRQAEDYLAEARQVVISDVNHDRKIVVAEMIHMMKAVMKEGFRTGQLNSVIGAANTLSRVAKL